MMAFGIWRRPPFVLVTSSLILAACGTDIGRPTEVVSIVVEPNQDPIVLVGETVGFQATALDGGGSPVPGTAVEWSTSDLSVANVDEKGLVTAIGEGLAEISARHGSVLGTATIQAADTTAIYRITFSATWDELSHPEDFPGNAHFSRLVGGTHGAEAEFWRVGSLASRGIKDMAERGRISPLDQEIETAIETGIAWSVFTGGNIPKSPDSTSMAIKVRAEFPLVTIVSMIAPSPDWFVGVESIPLFEEGVWTETLSLDLHPYDAGTDSGTTFDSADSATVPPMPISRIVKGPFTQGRSLGVFTFSRIMKPQSTVGGFDRLP